MAFGLVKKNSLLRNINVLLAAGNLPTLGDLAENAAKVAQEKTGEAKSLTNLALTDAADAQEEYQTAVAAATLVLEEKQKAVKAKLVSAAVLDDEARQLAAAADYFTK